MTISPLYIPALFGQMGDWTYFSTIMQLSEVAKRVSFANEVNQIREGHQLSDLIQRALMDGRAAEIARYLEQTEDRFFSSIVVAVYGGDPQWLEFGIEKSVGEKKIGPVADWAKSAFGFLHLTGSESLFALDGQHRLSGIREAVKATPSLASERVSVLFVGHKTDDVGRARSRKLFATLNKTAVAINKSEIIALDESDLYAIITRRLVETHPYFSNGQIYAQYNTANLSRDDLSHFMTIIKLYDCVAYIIGSITSKLNRDQRYKYKYVRLPDVVIEGHYNQVVFFFEKLVQEFSDLKGYFSKTGADARKIVRKERRDKKNVLFRAIGFDVFLRVIQQLSLKTGDWSTSIKIASKLPRGFLEAPYRNVSYSISEEKIILGRTRLIVALLLYMIQAQEATPELRKKYADALQATGVVRLPNRLARPAELPA